MSDVPLTLLEAAKLMEPSRARGIIETYASAYHPMTVAPVIRTSAYFKWSLEGNLPYTTAATGVRDINADFSATEATLQPYASETRVYGGKVKVDRKIVTESPESVAYQEMMQIKAMARNLSIDLFEGTGGSRITGIRTILENFEDFDNQTVNAASANTATITLDMLDEAISKVNVTPGTAIYANSSIIRTINSLSRANVSGSFGVTRGLDQFGVYAETYKGIPLVSMLDGKGANMLSVIEADADANETDAQSLYIVSWGEDMATLHSSNPGSAANGVPLPDVISESDGSNYKYQRLEWYVGLAVQSIRSIARIRYLA